MSDLFTADSTGAGAIFSSCGKYRYVLWRRWSEGPDLTVIGLNPSTANEVRDDPTIRRVKAIAANLGYGGIFMMNLFAIVSADPTILQTCDDPIRDNDKWLQQYATGDVIFAWGNFKQATERAKQVIAMFPNAKALFINKNGTPKHPLYCRKNIVPIPFNQSKHII